jgi:hypothetical protein
VQAENGHDDQMAIYHATLEIVQRSAGRSATAAIAYRAAIIVADTRTGQTYDYTRKRGVLHAHLVVPGLSAPDRVAFWNQIEWHHKRGDAVTARELVVALPSEIDQAAQIAVAVAMAEAIAKQYSVAVDVCVHTPSKTGDNRNYHAHILMSACTVGEAGKLGKKCEALDPIHCSRRKIPNAAEWLRPLWEQLVNDALAQAGESARIDHRSHAARGIVDAPGKHMGPAVTDMIRKGQDSEVQQRIDDEAARHTVEVLSRQMLEADAAVAALELIAEQASADLASEQSEVDRQRIEREWAIERKRQQEAQQKAQAAAAVSEAKRQHKQQLTRARRDHAQAEKALMAAQWDEMQARTAAEKLKPAYNAAIIEQDDAGRLSAKGLAKALKAASTGRASVWERAIGAYEDACAAVQRAIEAVSKAQDAVMKAWREVMRLDPAEQAMAAQQTQQRQRPKEGARPRTPAKVAHVHQAPEPIIEIEPESEQGPQQDRDRERGG